MGIPVDNSGRAKDFYTSVLGMEYLGRVGGNPNNPDSFPIHGVAQKLDRFRCGNGMTFKKNLCALGASAVNVLLFWLQLCRDAFSGKHPESSGDIH